MTRKDGQVLRAIRRLLQALAEEGPDDSDAPGAIRGAVDRQRVHTRQYRLSQLRSFHQVAQMGSVSKAAESLGITARDVSRHVRELEDVMEVTLFDRRGSGVALNPAGERLYEFVGSLMRSLGAE